MSGINGQQPNFPAFPLVSHVTRGPGPCPTEVGFAEVSDKGTGAKLIVMQVSTPSGVQLYFFDQASAKTMGEALLSMATGIVIAKAGAVRA